MNLSIKWHYLIVIPLISSIILSSVSCNKVSTNSNDEITSTSSDIDNVVEKVDILSNYKILQDVRDCFISDKYQIDLSYENYLDNVNCNFIFEVNRPGNVISSVQTISDISSVIHCCDDKYYWANAIEKIYCMNNDICESYINEDEHIVNLVIGYIFKEVECIDVVSINCEDVLRFHMIDANNSVYLYFKDSEINIKVFNNDISIENFKIRSVTSNFENLYNSLNNYTEISSEEWNSKFNIT